MSRPETGPMKFGDDWTGLFIRGDNAKYFEQSISDILYQNEKHGFLNTPGIMSLEALRRILRECNEFQAKEKGCQKMIIFDSALADASVVEKS